jgi:hypothetical protein
MVNRSDPNEINASSADSLQRRVEYISDPSHENHIGKDILPARNYNCPDQTGESFIRKVDQIDAAYRHYRIGKQGETVDRLWEEIIYSTLPGAYLTAAERDRIERIIIEKFGPDAAIRTAWHISPDGRADLHILMSAKAPTTADPDAYEVLFGRKVGNWIAACQATDRKIVRMLNANPHKHITHIAAYDKHKATTPSLAEQIAERHPDTRVTPHNLADFLADLGHKFIQLTKKSITLIYNGATTPVIRPLRDLLTDILAAQVRIKRQKRKERTTRTTTDPTHTRKTKPQKTPPTPSKPNIQ